MIEWGQWLKWNMRTESDDLWYLRTGVPNSDIVLTSSHAELCVSQPHCHSVRHLPISPLTHNWLTLVDFSCVSLSSCSLCVWTGRRRWWDVTDSPLQPIPSCCGTINQTGTQTRVSASCPFIKHPLQALLSTLSVFSHRCFRNISVPWGCVIVDSLPHWGQAPVL